MSELSKTLLQFFNILLRIVFDWGIKIFPYRRSFKPQILIIRLDAIGDFVLWLEAAKALYNYYQEQGKHVVLLGNTAWSDWANTLGLADEVWGIDPKLFTCNLRYRWRWLHLVRHEGFDLVIQPTFSRVFLEGDSIVRTSGAVERVGSEGDRNNMHPWLKWWSDKWYTRLIPASPRAMMELQRNAEFLHGLGMDEFTAQPPQIPPMENHPAVASSITPYAVLFPGASWSGRVWPSNRFAKVGLRLAARGFRIIIAGGPGDRQQSAQILSELRDAAIDMVGKTTISGLADILRGADIIISNETSAVHIGVAVGTPVLCILGGGHFGRFLPYHIEITDNLKPQPLPVPVNKNLPCYNCNWNCSHQHKKEKPVRCIEEISIDAVWSAIEKILATSN